jgi:hypothetical protein
MEDRIRKLLSDVAKSPDDKKVRDQTVSSFLELINQVQIDSHFQGYREGSYASFVEGLKAGSDIFKRGEE